MNRLTDYFCNLVRGVQDRIASFCYNSLDKSSKDFLDGRILHERERFEFDETYLFSGFKPNYLTKKIVRNLSRKGFMKRKKNGLHFLTDKSMRLEI